MAGEMCNCCLGTGRVVDMKALGEHYRQLREDAGIILSDMALAMGIDKSTLSYLERGRRRFTTYYAIRFEAALKTLGNSL